MTQHTSRYQSLLRYEWILFYVLVILNLLPAITVPFFPTPDGPAHLHNVNLIQQLMSSDSKLLSEYYSFNTELVPNWGGHFVLLSLNLVFSAALSAKIFIALCLFLLPVSFRYCIRKLNSESLAASYLILPFTYTMTFIMGFYNFHVGLIVVFFTIGCLIDFRENPIRIGKLLLLFFLVTFSYFSHLFAFMSIGLFIFGFTALDFLQAFLIKANKKELLKKTAILFGICIFPLLLSLNYFLNLHDDSNKVYLLKTELLHWLTNARSLICYNSEEESIYTTAIFLALFLLAAIAFYLRGNQLFIRAEKTESRLRSFFMNVRLQDLLFLMMLAFTFLYFKLPDSDPSAGFVSVRLNLMIFLFLLLWISGFAFPKWIIRLSVLVVLFAQFSLLQLHSKTFQHLNEEISEILVIERTIRPNTVILPVDYSGNWLTGHNGNYLGINKPVVLIENYECYNNYFPLYWKNKQQLYEMTNDRWNRLDLILRETPPEQLRTIDYIFVQGRKSFPDSVKLILQENFQLSIQTENMMLYKAKR